MFIGAPGSSHTAFPPVDGDSIEIAQANTSAGEPIGQISVFQGTVFITHPDGVKVQASDGASIFQGDVIETSTGGAIGITFADDSTFSLAENGSMVIDEMVYDPGSQAGKSALSVAEGVFTFVSGQIAKTDVEAMTITTPVAVIGIRGTAGGGKAGPEGTPNTFTMFQDPGGGTGEMVITTLGGTQVMNTPFQTTQISSKFVPPTIPVILPAAAVAQFYSKAAVVAPKAIPTGQQDAGPTDQGPTADAPGAEAQIDKAAQDAFEQTLAEGGDLEAAMAAAQDAATEAGLNAVLLENPDHFGGAGDEIMTRIVDNVLLDVTGQIDFMGAGTGGGLGFDDFTGTLFFENAIDGVIDNVIGDFVDNLFGNFFDGAFFGGGGDDFFDLFLDDPFADFTNDFFFSEDLFFADEFFFDDDIEFFVDEFFFEGFVDESFFFLDPVIFGEEFDLTGNTDILQGNTSNTEYILDQTVFGAGVYGGSDVINDAGGARDRITFEGVDNVMIRMTEKSGDSSRVTIDIKTLAAGLNIINTATQVTDPLDLSPDNTIDITKAVEDLQVLDSGFTNFDTGGVLLFGALDVTGSETGYIVAGSDAQNDVINLSGFNTSDTIGSIIFGKGGNDILTGTSSEDDIIGGAGDDTLDGDGGTNVLDGGSGNDTLNVTVASSTNDLDGGIGVDTLNYTALSNSIISTFSFGTTGSLLVSRSISGTVVGGDAVFSIEILNSGQGADVFNFNTLSLGFANINGGLGNDAFIFNTAGAQIAAVINGNAGTNTITLNAATFLAGSGGVLNVSSITGSAGNDTIKFIGAQTGVTVDLNGGTDTVRLDPGAGANTLTISDTEIITGGAGADTITLGAAQSSGTIDLAGGIDTLNLANGANTLTVINTETINGNSGVDNITVTGSTGATIIGGGGNDVFVDDVAARNLTDNFPLAPSAAVNVDLEIRMGNAYTDAGVTCTGVLTITAVAVSS